MVKQSVDKSVYVAISKIDPNPFQTRFLYAQESTEELKRSIKQLGIVTPLVLRPVKNRFQLVSGSRRLRAAHELGLKAVPAITRELSDNEVMEITITENLQREDLNAIEEALGFKKLLEEFNYTHEKLAKRLGKSRSYITNSLRLLKLNSIVQSDVLCKTITAWHGRCLLSLEEHVQYHFSNLIMDWNWSVAETRENVKRYREGEQFLVWKRDIPIDAIKTDNSLRLRTIPENSRQLRALAISIKENGLINPIHVNVAGSLIDGHGRLKVCKSLGWKLIPAFIIYWCTWLTEKGKPVSGKTAEIKGNPILDKLSEIKGNPILDKLSEMKIEPWYTRGKEIPARLAKGMILHQLRSNGKSR